MKKSRKPTTAEKIEALEWARRLIAGHGGFICLTLDSISELRERLTPACLELINYIETQLRGCYPKRQDLPKGRTLKSWVMKHRPNLPVHGGAMTKYRLQWIDWMIASLEGKEP